MAFPALGSPGGAAALKGPPAQAASDQSVLDAAKTHGPVSRQDLASLTGLSAATINRAVARLTKGQMLVAAKRAASTGGRPAELLAYNGQALAVAGLSVTDQAAAALIMSLEGEVVGRHQVEFALAAGTTPESRLTQSLEWFDSLLAAPQAPLAVGVAVPGVVSGDEGMVTAAHELGWDRLALGSLLAGRTTIPVVVENDANCLAVGEFCRGFGSPPDDLVAIVLRSGMGTGLVLNRQLYRGFHNEAGEIGYMLMGRESLNRRFPARGDLESLLGSDGVARRASELGVPVGDGQVSLPALMGVPVNETAAGRLAGELLDHVALAIAALCVILDPQVVVFGGHGDAQAMAAVIPKVRDRLMGRILRLPQITTAALGDDAIMIGAAQLALEAVATRP